MATIHFAGKATELREGETVLEGLERAGESIPNSCRAGSCQSCTMVAVEGAVPPAAQQGLKATQREQGRFLSCICRPEGDLTVRMPDDVATHEAVAVSSVDAGAGVRIVRMEVPAAFAWRAGQYATLLRADGLSRCYSIASLPSDGHVELHVRRVPGGAMSNWIHDDLQPGDRVRLRGPLGECFYAVPCDPASTLLLGGTGTGLAPLVGIVRDALARGHAGPIRLFHGALRASGLYHRAELAELAASHPNVRIEARVLEGPACDGGEVGPLDEAVAGALVAPRETRAYLCGDPAFVEKLKRRLFLKGLSSRSIFADPFVSAPSPARPAPAR